MGEAGGCSGGAGLYDEQAVQVLEAEDMRNRGQLQRFVSAVVAVVAVGLVGGCGAGQQGPLRPVMVAGGSRPVVVAGGSLVTPGQPAVATAYVDNHSAVPVTLVSASVITVPGFPAGRLRHVAVAVAHNSVQGGHGWPPSGVALRPLRGARLGRGETGIVLGISGPRAGRDYVVAGLRITYRYEGKLYSMSAWVATVACVVTSIPAGSGSALRSCSRTGQRAQATVIRQASGG